MLAANISEVPLLTVAMPVFNAGIHLRSAVVSIINQTFENWELLLIDDGSTDSSIDSVADIDDSRLHVIRDGENRGLAARLNEAIDLAHGEVFARMDQDDISHPERFALQLQKLLSDPSIDLLGAQCITISEDNEILGVLPNLETHEEICAHPWRAFYLAHPTWIGRTKWFREHRYASPGPYCCEDQELLLRTHKVSRFYVLPQKLLAYRLRSYFNWSKAWRTRISLLKVQWHYFKNTCQYAVMYLAAMYFLLSVGKDMLSLVKQHIIGKKLPLSESLVLSETDKAAWRSIFRQSVESQGKS